MGNPTQRDAAAGRFQSAPDPRLAKVVVEYWGFARDLAAMGGFTVTPDCFGELICCVDDLYAVEAGVRRKLPRFFLVDLLDGPLRLEADGVIRCMSARLRPWALGEIAGAGGGSGRGWRDALAVFGDRADDMARRVERRDWTSCAGLLNEILRGIYTGSGAGAMGPVVAGPFLGDAPITTAAVARERGVTRRQVERLVRALTRCSPKRLACLSRFQRARDAIWADPATDLAALAYDAGYADQPHLSRDFRRFAGQTPGQFLRASVEGRRPISPDVAIVQEPTGRDS